MDTDATALAELVLAARVARHAHITSYDEQPMAGETWDAWMKAMRGAEDMAEGVIRTERDRAGWHDKIQAADESEEKQCRHGIKTR